MKNEVNRTVSWDKITFSCLTDLPVSVNCLVSPPTPDANKNNNNKSLPLQARDEYKKKLQKVIRESTVLAEEERYGFIAGL